jgi:integrase
MNNFSFKSSLGEEMRQYVRLKIALGRRYKEGIAILQSLDRFLSDLPWRRQDLTAETFESWCKTQTGVTARVRRQRMYVIHNFCLYRRRTVPECFVPNSNLFPVWKKYQTITPYIFSASEVAKLMKAALNLERTIVAPLRPEVIRLGIMLLYTSGLRHREVLRLVISDFDRRQGTLLIRASKFHKTRVVPLSPGVTREIDRYLRLRCCHKLPAQSNTPLISHQKQGLKGYSLQGFWYNFRCLLNTCNIRTASGGLPRINDLRHSCGIAQVSTCKQNCHCSRRTWGMYQ